MKDPAVLARDTTPDAKEMVLYRRDGVFTLRVDGLELMSSRAHGSEDALARLACRGLEEREKPRVLVGGLGFGYTLRAALDRLPASAAVVVCEIFESLMAWNREFLGELARHPLDDPRVEAIHADVWDLLEPHRPFDAILLDVDNGPRAFTLRSNARLYGLEGMARMRRALSAAGRIAVWSSEPAPDFERALAAAGFEVATHRLPVRGRTGPSHTIFVATPAGTEVEIP